MNHIEKMLQDYCPNGVEWKELGEVAEIGTGKNNTNEQVENGKYPFYVRSKDIKSINNYLFDEEAIIIPGEGGIGEIFHYVNGKYGLHQRAYRIHIVDDKVDTRFIYYYLQAAFKKFILKKAVSATVSSIRKPMIERFPIPIPPLEIQKEIVALLDKFTEYVTELTAELTAELTDRQKQYSFYRDKLLSFEDEVYQVEWKTLGEVAGFRRGSFPQPYGEKEWYGGENSQPFVQVADISENGYCLNASTQKRISQKAIPKSVFVPKGTVLVTLQGTIGRVAVTQYDAYVDRTIAIFDDYKCDIDIKYFAYQLKRKFDIEKEFARGSTLKTITKQEFSQFQIPIPPLPIQQRIVEVLDNFDAVCNDLNIGLPKEIELRKKQYEYFREKLLTFTAEGVYPGQWTVDSERGLSDLIRLLQWVFGTIRVELGAVASVVRGKRLVRKELSHSEGYPVYQNSLNALGYYKDWNTPANTTFIISAGAAGEIGYSNQNFWKADDVWTIETAVISQRFIFHVLSQKKDLLKSQVRKASVPRLSKTSIENLSFILPSLEEQSHIVAILDKFDELTTSISQGLSKEIELRQKQYEYFRDKLLTF